MLILAPHLDQHTYQEKALYNSDEKQGLYRFQQIKFKTF